MTETLQVFWAKGAAIERSGFEGGFVIGGLGDEVATSTGWETWGGRRRGAGTVSGCWNDGLAADRAAFDDRGFLTRGSEVPCEELSSFSASDNQIAYRARLLCARIYRKNPRTRPESHLYRSTTIIQ